MNDNDNNIDNDNDNDNNKASKNVFRHMYSSKTVLILMINV